MSHILIIPKRIVTLDKGRRILNNHDVEIFNNKIKSINKVSAEKIKSFKGEIIHAEDLTLIPGFVQTHVHLCQTLFRGMADDLELLDWLQLKIFPFENAHNKKSLLSAVKLGINELTLSGTTTILDMGTLRHQEVIFDELIASGIRAVAGKCMIDMNDLFPGFKSSTNNELKESHLLSKAFHNEAEGRIKYGFAPRFALSSSAKLMSATKEMMQEFSGSIFHTHSSENTNEINLLKKKNVRVAHCPSSNLKLGSGFAPIPIFLKKGISVSLGADGAPCNNKLSMFDEMRLASLIQKPKYNATAMDAETVFRLATIEGAKALHLEKEIGTIETGKKADLVLINLDDTTQSVFDEDENVYSRLVYSSSGNNVRYVMIDGRWIVKSGKSKIYDQKETFSEAKSELKKLLRRI